MFGLKCGLNAGLKSKRLIYFISQNRARFKSVIPDNHKDIFVSQTMIATLLWKYFYN